MKLCGGIEAGGTKFVCLVGRGPQDIQAEARFPTTTPQETLEKAVEFFKNQSLNEPICALGVGSFGPVDLDPASPTFGHITTTPKPGWAYTDMVGPLQATLDIPVVFDTDVNAAAFGEFHWGAAQGLDPSIYLTIGTGIGGGIICGERPIHGLVHPEIGHMLIPHNRDLDPFPGVCPYHGDCFEGLASGPAIKQRWDQAGELLPVDHPAWELEAHIIALALVNLILCYSPRKIVLGGGVMQQKGLFPLIRQKVQQNLNRYVRSEQITEHIDQYIVPPALGNRAGVLGAVALAMDSLSQL
ncbi:MAG TPA: ROK family protein [Anaerolineales bacterium]